jgi:EAL domain-containing protein (putative c-di-GMP-specific phosphodiesterase class I)
LEETIAKYRIRKENLQLELTETALVRNENLAIRQLNRLRDLGLKVQLDDFGTGYSSLRYLNILPVDTIKIDKSFVQQLPENQNAKAICMGIINLATVLHKEVIAEGVETAEQAECLKSIGCGTGQGYLFMRPTPSKEAFRPLTQADTVHYA